MKREKKKKKNPHIQLETGQWTYKNSKYFHKTAINEKKKVINLRVRSKDLLENDCIHILGNHWIEGFHPNLTSAG